MWGTVELIYQDAVASGTNSYVAITQVIVKEESGGKLHHVYPRDIIEIKTQPKRFSWDGEDMEKIQEAIQPLRNIGASRHAINPRTDLSEPLKSIQSKLNITDNGNSQMAIIDRNITAVAFLPKGHPDYEEYLALFKNAPELREVLQRLVSLKEEKESKRKTSNYLSQKERAWMDAQHILEKIISEEGKYPPFDFDDPVTKDRPLKQFRTFTEDEIAQLQTRIHKITGDGDVMVEFNKILGVAAGS